MTRLTRTFEHGGGTLIDEMLGEGDRHLVFLHGWRSNRDSLRGIGTLFEQTHRVHLIDLPGFGEAPVPPSNWDTNDYASLVHAYLVSQGAAPFVLIGHSFGGRLAVRLAGRRVPELRGIVLMAVPGLPLRGSPRLRARRWGIRTLRALLRSLQSVTGSGPLDWHTRRFGSKDYQAAGELRPIFVRTVNEDLTELARANQVPALLLWGSQDTETPPWLAEAYSSLMNGHATVSVLPHKDHYLYTGTGAHLCALKIRSWLQGGPDHLRQGSGDPPKPSAKAEGPLLRVADR